MKRIQYLYKIYPVRHDFYTHENEADKAIMAQHMDYWEMMASDNVSILYGPVYDPQGTYSMAIIDVPTREEAESIATGDPAVVSNTFTYTLFPMQVGLLAHELNHQSKKLHYADMMRKTD